MINLCVGAVSPTVVDVAATLQVHQIVASRRQVNAEGGYIGMTQEDLVARVTELSNGETKVVRDHGGPYQGSDLLESPDAWRGELKEDVAAGFHGLHLDVSKLPIEDQGAELVHLADMFAGSGIELEIGGERDWWIRTSSLLNMVKKANLLGGFVYCVIDLGGHIHADRQIGFLAEPMDYDLQQKVAYIHDLGLKAKAHNMDWVGQRWRWDGVIDAMNIAPEFVRFEYERRVAMMDVTSGLSLLAHASHTGLDERWFVEGEGTFYYRALCALTYLQNDPVVKDRMDATDLLSNGAFEEVVKSEVEDLIRNWDRV